MRYLQKTRLGISESQQKTDVENFFAVTLVLNVIDLMQSYCLCVSRVATNDGSRDHRLRREEVLEEFLERQ